MQSMKNVSDGLCHLERRGIVRLLPSKRSLSIYNYKINPEIFPIEPWNKDKRKLFSSRSSNPREIFNCYWTKCLPERTFSEEPFPLRGSLVRLQVNGSPFETKNPPLVSQVSEALLKVKEDSRRCIFGIIPFRGKAIHTASSDSFLDSFSAVKSSFRKASSTSALMKNRRRTKRLSVTFDPNVDIVEYEKGIEFYAQEDWSKYYV